MNKSAPLFSAGLYRIQYANGVTQEKYLVEQFDYEHFYLTATDMINKVSATKPRDADHKQRLDGFIARMRQYLTDNFGDFFTTDSPLGRAITTGKLELPAHQGGTQPVIITQL